MPFNPASLLPYWKYGVMALLALALAFAWARGNDLKHQRDKAREQVASWQAANEASTRWAKLERAAREAESRATAERIEREARTSLADAESRRTDYIARNRCVPIAASAGRVSPAPAAKDQRPADPAGTGGAPFMVAVQPDDLRICDANTVKAEAGNKLARALVD